MKTAYRDIALFPVAHMDYPYSIASVFSTAPDPSQLLPKYRPSLTIGSLTYVDYRYNRFALDPRTGLFGMIRYVSSGSLWFMISHYSTYLTLGIGETRHGRTSLVYKMVYRDLYRCSALRCSGPI